jgi:GNAT superfamily N-acetyltransferase
MSALLARLRFIGRSRGVFGLVAFVATRILRFRSDILFGMDVPPGQGGTAAVPPDAVVVVDRSTLSEARSIDVARQVLTGYNEVYREGLHRDEILYAFLDGDGNVLSYAFVLFDTRAKRVLRLPTTVPLIANCYTRPEARGRRLYPGLLRFAAADLARRGHERIFINCTSDNTASIRGIEAAGFARIAEIRSGLFLSRIVFLQRVKAA